MNYAQYQDQKAVWTPQVSTNAPNDDALNHEITASKNICFIRVIHL